MAEVYRANDRILGREVALKLLKPFASADAELRQRLVREARAAAALELPSVVQVHDVDATGHFIVMELVKGETLSARLKRGALSGPELRALAKSLCSALAAAHDRGIVHRDVKPSNILLADGGAKLTDFGVAQVADSQELTRTGGAVGTLRYMAPEQLRGAKGSPKSDIYSAGVTLFEAATATRFHDESGMPHPEPYRAVLEATGDRRIAEGIARATAFDVTQRFSSAAELLAHLERKLPTRRTVGIALGGLAAAGLGVAALALRPRIFRSEAERRLAEGIAALERHDLERANAAFESVLVEDPHNVEALFHLTLVLWWLGRSPAEVDRALGPALSQGLSASRRGMLLGLRLLQDNDFPRARTYFEDLAAMYPNDRDIAYGQFEARFHGGFPADAMQAHARLRRLDPGFQLGDIHARDYLLAHGRVDELARLVGKQADAPLWPASIAIARGDLATAARELDARIAAAPNDAYAHGLRLHVALLAGDRPKLDAMLAAGDNYVAKLMLAALWGDDAAWARERARMLERRAQEAEAGRVSLLNQVMLMSSCRPGDDGAHELLAAAAQLEPRNERSQRMKLGQLFQLARLRDRDRIAAFAGSPLPEVASAANGFLAELDQKWPEAAAAWSAAVESSTGEYLPAERLGHARAALEAGQPDVALQSLDRARHPSWFTPSWASAAGPALVLEVAAHAQRGESELARQKLAELKAQRYLAASSDALLADAARLQALLEAK